MNYKLSLFTALSVGLLSPVENVQASTKIDTCLGEEFVLMDAPVKALYRDIDVCLDIMNDAQGKVSAKTILQEEVISREIPDNIDRLTFNALGFSEMDAVEYAGLTWRRVKGEDAKAFSKNLPDARCVYSNTTKGLQIKSIKEEDSEFTITYRYAASIFATKNFYEFSVKTVLGSYGSLQREIQDLERRRKQIFFNPTLDLEIENSEKMLMAAEDRTVPTARVLKLLKVAQDQFSVSKEKLQRFYQDCDDSKVSYKQYTCFAWNVYQFRDLIQQGLEEFIDQLESGKKVEKLREFLDVYGRNMKLHYETNIEMFSKWADGEDIPFGMGALFEKFIEG